MAIPEDWVRWGGVACWVARVRSLAIPGLVGEAGWQGGIACCWSVNVVVPYCGDLRMGENSNASLDLTR